MDPFDRTLAGAAFMRATHFGGIATLCLLLALAAGAVAGIGVFGRGDMASETVTSVRGESYELIKDGVYAYNSERLVAEGVGWDIFTLFIVVPAMLIALPALRRGSLVALLFVIGLLGYLFYQYLMYAMAWAFGPLFLPFVVIYAMSLAAIVWIISTIDVSALPTRFDSRFPAKGMAIFSFVMALLLVSMWAQRISVGLSGDLEGAMLLGQTTMVVQGLDLGLIVPLAVFTGLMVWQKRAWGYLLASVLVVKAIAMCGAITAMLVSAWVVEGAPDIGGLAIFVTAAFVSLWLGHRMLRSAIPAGIVTGTAD